MCYYDLTPYNEKLCISDKADVCDNADWKLQFLQSFIYWPMYKFI